MKKTLITTLLALASVSAFAKPFVTHCTVTTYNAVESQCDSDPLVTANGTKINHHDLRTGKQRIVAVSRELLCLLPYNSVIEIEGHGRYVVADIMNKRFDHYIDILIPDDKHFKKKNVKVTLIKKCNQYK